LNNFPFKISFESENHLLIFYGKLINEWNNKIKKMKKKSFIDKLKIMKDQK